MKTALLQCNPVTGDIAGNIERISQAVRRAGKVDLCVTPELALSGVAPGDFLSMNDFVEGCRKGLDILAARFVSGPDLLVGAPVVSVYEPSLLSNAAVYIHRGQWDVISRKVRPEARGVDAIIHMRATPYVIGKRADHEAMLTHVAARHHIHLLSVNIVGGNDGLVFAGQSLALDPTGTVYARGQAFAEALGDKAGITRFADCTVPLDEALVQTVVDISGRGQAYCTLPLPTERVGAFDAELAVEFFYAFARDARLTLHVRELAGANTHHIIEAAFKSAGRAMRAACALDPRVTGVPSTKGAL